MNGADNRQRPSRGGPNPEDLDAVLGRFQQWTKSQTPGKNGVAPQSSRRTAAKDADLAAGARELTYEQALEASRHRRRVYATPVETAAALPKASSAARRESQEHERGSLAKPQEERGADETGSRKQEISPTVAKIAGRLDEKPRAAAPVPAVVKLMAQPEPVEADDKMVYEPPLARRSSSKLTTTSPSSTSNSSSSHALTEARMRRRSQGNPPSKPGEAGPLVRRGVETIESTSRRTSERSPSIPLSPAPDLMATRPPFCEVLTSTALVVPVRAAIVPESRSRSLSFRISEAQYEAIRVCADRANLSMSEYLRQCALGASPQSAAGLLGLVKRCLRLLRRRDDFIAISLH